MPGLAELRSTYKRSDAWWTVLLVDPTALRLLWVAVRLRDVTPNRVTVAALALGLGSAACFLRGWLLLGALLYHAAFVLDCVDGKLARWLGTHSAFGAWLDIALDRVRVVACTAGLMGGQYMATGRPAYLYLGLVIVFLDVFRQWNGLQVFTMREDMQRQLHRVDPAALDLQHGRSAVFARVRAGLQARRIRVHLFSGVEFQMAIFIVGPVTGLVLPLGVAASLLFVVFELLIAYKFWLATLDYDRALVTPPVPRRGTPTPARRA